MAMLDATPLRVAEAGKLLERALARKTVRSVYQPIVDLPSGEVVAYEALARGPVGHLEFPGALFDAAERTGLLPHLEWSCREAALQGAIDAGLGSVMSLFINVEPRITGTELPKELESLMRTASHKLRIVLELTERDLTRRPADLLRLVRWARSNWWGVALDDVGAEPASLALLPFVRPDVIKLDMRLIQEPDHDADRETIDAVHYQQQRTGATVLAEGIETEEHEEVAHKLGATLGQGWRYGRPGPLVVGRPPVSPVRFLPHDGHDPDSTPFDVVAGVAGTEVRTVRQSELDELSRHVEDQVVADGAPVLLSSFGPEGTFTDVMARRYAGLADVCLFTGVSGQGVSGRQDDRVRYSDLDRKDPLAREWVVTVVGTRHARALVARGLTRAGTGDDPEVELATTDDRDTVIAVARSLMERAVPR
jgi:EAL domain-containing protein (putative c-di-GMP-specific phosphodiesterase class I)